MQMSKCPHCSSDVMIEDDAYEGDLLTCANCERDIELTSLNPTRLGPMEDDEHDTIEEVEEYAE